MKKILDQRGYRGEFKKEEFGKHNTKITEEVQVLGSRKTEVGATTNGRDTTKPLKHKRRNHDGPNLIDRATECANENKRAKLNTISNLTNDALREATTDEETINTTAGLIASSEFDPYDANTCDDTENTCSKLNEEAIEILNAVNEAKQNIAQNPDNKAIVLRDLFQKAILFVDGHPAKKIAFEFLHTEQPDNVAIFEKFGSVLERQDPKAAKALYAKGLLNNKLFKQALFNIKLMMKGQENTPVTLALKTELSINLINSIPTALFDHTVIDQIKAKLKDPSNLIHKYLEEFIEEEIKERNIFLED